ncbi:MAG: hypothetical protein MJZ06_03620 [Bacteroidaceae bacterium]|nr:hypothetical protein [Bacteroidaceae bacterium]
MSKTNLTLFALSRVTTSPTTDNYVDRDNYIVYYDDGDYFDDCVLMTSHMYETIFGEKWKEQTIEKRILPIVKITYNGESIYRRYRAIGIKGLKKGDVVLTRRSISLLSPKDSIIGEGSISLSPGDEKSYYQYCPDHSARMSYRLSRISNKIGRISLAVSIISLVASIIALYVTLK